MRSVVLHYRLERKPQINHAEAVDSEQRLSWGESQATAAFLQPCPQAASMLQGPLPTVLPTWPGWRFLKPSGCSQCSGTVQCHAAPCHAVQHRAMLFSTVQYHAAQRDVVLCKESHAMLCEVVQHHKMSCSAVQSCAVLCKVVQQHVMPCSTVQCRSALCNIVQHCAKSCSAVQSHAGLCDALQHPAAPCTSCIAAPGLPTLRPGTRCPVHTRTSPLPRPRPLPPARLSPRLPSGFHYPPPS